MARPEDITVARLHGTAHRLLREKADPDTCIATLHEITTDPTILGEAAGTSLGAWQANQRHDADRVARMLTAAGADLEVRDRVAAETKAHLDRERGRPGIGMRG